MDGSEPSLDTFYGVGMLIWVSWNFGCIHSLIHFSCKTRSLENSN